MTYDRSKNAETETHVRMNRRRCFLFQPRVSTLPFPLVAPRAARAGERRRGWRTRRTGGMHLTQRRTEDVNRRNGRSLHRSSPVEGMKRKRNEDFKQAVGFLGLASSYSIPGSPKRFTRNEKPARLTDRRRGPSDSREQRLSSRGGGMGRFRSPGTSLSTESKQNACV